MSNGRPAGAVFISVGTSKFKDINVTKDLQKRVKYIKAHKCREGHTILKNISTFDFAKKIVPSHKTATLKCTFFSKNGNYNFLQIPTVPISAVGHACTFCTLCYIICCVSKFRKLGKIMVCLLSSLSSNSYHVLDAF